MALMDKTYPTQWHLGPPMKLRKTSPIVYQKRLQTKTQPGVTLLMAASTVRDRLCAATGNPPGGDCIDTIPAAVRDFVGVISPLVHGDGVSDFSSPCRGAVGDVMWTSFTNGATTAGVPDALYDVTCALTAAAVSLHSYASAQCALKDNDAAMKAGFKALTTAVGLLTFAAEHCAPRLPGTCPPESGEKGIRFLLHVCTAHAQELVMARAEAGNQPAQLMCELAVETAKNFTAAVSLTPPGPQQRMWQNYLTMKSNLFLALAFTLQAEISSKDAAAPNWPVAVTAATEAMKHFQGAQELAKVYTKESKVPDPLPQIPTTGRHVKKECDVVMRTNQMVHRAKPLPDTRSFLPAGKSTLPVTPFAWPQDARAEITPEGIRDIHESNGPKPPAGTADGAGAPA